MSYFNFGKLACLLAKQHKWGKPTIAYITPNSEPTYRKLCQRCGTYAQVKRRAKK